MQITQTLEKDRNHDIVQLLIQHNAICNYAAPILKIIEAKDSSLLKLVIGSISKFWFTHLLVNHLCSDKSIKKSEYFETNRHEAFLSNALQNYDEEIVKLLLEISTIGLHQPWFKDWEEKSPLPPKVKLLFDVMHGKIYAYGKPTVILACLQFFDRFRL